MDKLFFGVLLTSVIACTAEPPRFGRQRLGRLLARPEIDDPNAESNGGQGPYPAAVAPYPPAGYRPNREFNLPTEEQNLGQVLAAAPVQAYGAPARQYGSPADPRNAEPEEVSDDDPSDESEFEAVNIQGNNQAQRLTEEKNGAEGVYYVQLQNGLTQPITYVAAPLNSPILAKIQVQPVLQAQPLVLGPKAYSYTAQYQSW